MKQKDEQPQKYNSAAGSNFKWVVVILAAVAILIAGGTFYWWEKDASLNDGNKAIYRDVEDKSAWNGKNRLKREKRQESQNPEGKIISMEIKKPNLVVVTQNVARVEIWAIPSGTEIRESDYILLGDADNRHIESNGKQEWLFPIPKEPVLATEIFAKGYDGNNEEVGKLSLPYLGVTGLNKALGTINED